MRDNRYSSGRRSRSRSPPPRRRSRSPASHRSTSGMSSRLTAKKLSPPRMRSDDAAASKPSLSSRLRTSSRERKRRDRRGASASPSPPRSRARHDSPPQPRRRDDETFRITVSTAPAANPKSEVSERQRRAFLEMRQRDLTSTEKPRFAALGSRTKDDRGQIFAGPEFGEIDAKEQRKIQIDIRRNIPSHRISQSPIRRSIHDANSIVISRGKEEGYRPIFDRDEINDWLPRVAEQRSINIVGKAGGGGGEDSRRFRSPSPDRRRHRSRSPLGNDVRSRLGRVDDRRRSDGRRRDDPHRNGSGNVRDRLGDRHRGRDDEAMDEDRVLNREELEMQRPVVKPWDINPEFVPRGRNYFEVTPHKSVKRFP